MFAEIDDSIRRLLVEKGNLDNGEVDIAFQMPTRQWEASISRPTINVYLFDIRENTELRNPNPWVVRQGPGNTVIKSRAEIRMDLTYKIAAFATTVEDEHRLLARTLVTLLQNPVLPQEVLDSSLAEQEIPGTVVSGAVTQNGTDYWNAMNNDVRPTLDYRVTTRIDLSQEIEVGLALTSRSLVSGKDAEGKAEAEATRRFRIGGKIHRREDPETALAGALVSLVERGLDTTTDQLGRFVFSRVPAGSYTLEISAPGMEEVRSAIRVPSPVYDVAI
ncbi:MAG: Pvc16 family protein [Chloroflexota bacterium]|nr:Pvc16 family protein [Chloroflexota bacterium]